MTMVRGGGSFSSEEIQLLRGLAAVSNVTQDRITYSDTFKQVCTIRYLAGESPTKIFREAGLPPDLIGYKRIERSVARWKAAAIRSVNGNGNMSDSEVIAQLVERYKCTLVTRQNLDSVAENIIGTKIDANTVADGAETPLKTEQALSIQDDDAEAADVIDAKTACIIIKQQARRIDELEKANEALRRQIAGSD